MNIDNEASWLLYNLWLKTGPSPPKFPFAIADTIVYSNGHPETWYFTSKEGFILKKNKENVNAKTIH